MGSAMTRVDHLRAQARTLYQQAQSTDQPDESLLHVFHAIELETEADSLEPPIPAAHVVELRGRNAA